MLAELRKHSKSVIIYVLFGIIIVVFVFTFNMSSRRRDSSVGYGRQYENADLVVVGDSRIDVVDLEMGLRLTTDAPVPGKERTADSERQERAYRQYRFHDFPGDPSLAIFGQDPMSVASIKSRKVKEDLVETWLVSEEARKNGLVATPDEVRDRILKRFSDPSTGEFKRSYYENWVRYQIRTTMPRFEDFVAREIEREKMISLVTSAVAVPEREAKYVAGLRKNARSYEFLEISPSLLGAALAGNQKELAAWQKANQKAVRDYFDANTSEFAQEAGLDFHVLKYSDESRAKEVFEGLNGMKGEELRDAMTALAPTSEDKVTNEIGGRSQAALSVGAIASLYGQEVADAAQKLTELELSPVVKTAGGYFLLMLDARRPKVEPVFEEVSEVIARRLFGEQKAAAEMEAISTAAIAALNAAPERPLAEVATELNAKYAPHSPVRVGETGEVRKLPPSVMGLFMWEPDSVRGIGKGKAITTALESLTNESRVLQQPLKPEGGSSVFVVRLAGEVKVLEPTREEIDTVASELALFKRVAVWRDWFDALRSRAASSGDLVEKELLAKMIADEEKALEQAVSGTQPTDSANAGGEETQNN